MGEAKEQVENSTSGGDGYDDKRFHVLERARWKQLKDLKYDTGAGLNGVTETIEVHNPSLNVVR